MKYRFAFLCVVAAVCGCRVPFVSHTLPPATMMQHPGPGVDGPGPGVMTIGDPAGMMPLQNSQVAFIGPEGATVAWSVGQPGVFDSEPLVAPARSNFPQGSLYRLKLTDLPGRPGVELYPTIEIAPAVHRTEAYLSHNAIPIQFTEEDLDQVLSGNFVTKVIFLPDPEFQELAVAGVQELVSTRLDPGQDPIVEADRQGAIMAIIRVGNKDLEVPGLEGSNDGGLVEGSGLYQGVQQAQYGIPITGTPIGLPGPPHIPLGSPAGLQKHSIKNHTFQHYPHPSKKQSIHVKQTPGMSYPKPANHAYIHEHARAGLGGHGGGGNGAEYCPPQQ